ncbi:MAG: hypothetical protein RL112_2273, partial [Planctomycetota bacterium]
MTRAKWLKRGAIAVGTLAGLRLLLAAGAHPVAGMVASNRGLDLRFDAHSLSLLQGTLELRGLRCGGDSTPPFLVAERIHVDLGLRDLASGRLVVEELDVDGLRLAAGVDAQGRLRLGGGYDPARLAGEALDDASRADADAQADPGSLLLPAVLPLELRRARVRHAKLEWLDEGEGGGSETFELEAEADRLLAPGADGRAMVRVSAPGLLDGARVVARTSVDEGQGEPHAGRTNLELEARLAGLRSPRLAMHLRRFGVVARGERIDGALTAALELVGSAEVVEGVVEPRTTASFVLREATLSGDGAEAVGLALASMRVQHRPQVLRVDEARLAGPRARLVVEPDGIPVFAGLGFDASRVQPAAPTPASSTAQAAPPGVALQAAGFELSGARVEVVDARATPPRIHALEDGELRLEVLPSAVAGDLAAKLVAGARLPGVARSVEARAEGSYGQSATLALEAGAEQVDLSRLADLLAPLGLAPAARPADLTAKATLAARRAGDGWVVSGRVEDLSARDGIHALSAGSASLVDFSFGAAGLVVESLAWRDVEADVRRSQDGVVHLPLVSWTGAAAGSDAAPPPSPATGVATGGRAAPPSLRIGKLELGARRLRFADEAAQPQTTWELVDAAFALDELRAGGDGAQGARWSASARAPGLWSSASAAGTLEVSPAWRVRLDARLRADGLRLAHGQAYLTKLGLQALEGATTMSAALQADARIEGEELRLSTTLSDAAWTTDGVELAACRALRVEGLVARPDGLVVEQLEVDGARLAVRRDAQGGFHALGLRFDPRAATPATPPQATPPAKAPANAPFAQL